MLKLAVTLLLVTGPLWGCATQDSHDQLLRQALQERDVAYARLTKAMATYCAVGNDSLETRLRCMSENLGGLHSKQPLEALHSTRIATIPTPSPRGSARTHLPEVSCERTRFETTCQRTHPTLTQDEGKERKAVVSGVRRIAE